MRGTALPDGTEVPSAHIVDALETVAWWALLPVRTSMGVIGFFQRGVRK